MSKTDRLMLAQVEYLAHRGTVSNVVPEDKQHLASLLQSLLEHEAVQELESGRRLI